MAKKSGSVSITPNKILKWVGGMAVVVGGVMAAGLAMYQFRGKVALLDKARNGFQGVA